MKQKTLLRISSLIISLILCLLIATYRPQTPCEHKSILAEIQLLKSTVLELTEDKTDRQEELIRENVILRQTVIDQAKQIKEFGWMKETSKNIK